MSKTKIGLLCLGLIVLFLALDLAGVLWDGFILGKKEEIRRDVFEESRAFNEGVVRDIASYRLQWLEADSETARGAIESTVCHRFPNYSIDDLPAGELRSWFLTVRGY